MRKRKIRERNDRFRANPANGDGRLAITRGIAALGEIAALIVFHRVLTFSTFTEDNDPWGEHDFGAFDFQGMRIFWKIDYYDTEYRFGSNDPANFEETRLLLTIMLASEY